MNGRNKAKYDAFRVTGASEIKAHTEGHTARASGSNNRRNNPYPASSRCNMAWRHGWDEADSFPQELAA